MSNTAIIDLTTKNSATLQLSNPYAQLNELYELVANKINNPDDVTDSQTQYLTAEAVNTLATAIATDIANNIYNNVLNNLLPAKEDTSKKITDFFAPERPDGAYPTASAVESLVMDKTDYLTANIGTIYELIDGMKTDIFNLSENKENVSNKINTISSNPSAEKYPSELAIFERFMSFDNDIKTYISGLLGANYYDTSYIDSMFGEIETATANIIALQNQYIGDV